MKTKVLKSLLPLAVVAIAVVGAFSTHAMDKESARLDNLMGYEHVSQLEPCVERIECAPTGDDPCTFGGEQLYEKITDVSCPNPLRKVEQ